MVSANRRMILGTSEPGKGDAGIRCRVRYDIALQLFTSQVDSRSSPHPGAATMARQPSQLVIAALPSLPGIDGRALHALFDDRGLVGRYDHLVGGAISNGSLLVLGIMPYLSARSFVRLGRAASPTLDAWTSGSAGRKRLARCTRVLTVGLSLIQSYGFTQFALSVPGVAATPGPAFVIRTRSAMTLGALCMMWMGEQATASDHGHESNASPTPIDADDRTPSAKALPAASGGLDALAPWRSRPAEALRVTPLPGRAGRAGG